MVWECEVCVRFRLARDRMRSWLGGTGGGPGFGGGDRGSAARQDKKPWPIVWALGRDAAGVSHHRRSAGPGADLATVGPKARPDPEPISGIWEDCGSCSRRRKGSTGYGT